MCLSSLTDESPHRPNRWQTDTPTRGVNDDFSDDYVSRYATRDVEGLEPDLEGAVLRLHVWPSDVEGYTGFDFG